MINLPMLMRRLDKLDPRLKPIEDIPAEKHELVLRIRMGICEFILSVVDDFDGNPVRDKAREVLEQIELKRRDLKQQLD